MTEDDSIPHLLEQARRHWNAKDFFTAEAMGRQVLQLDPNNVKAMQLLADLAARGRQPEAAIELLDRAAGLEPENLDVQITMGNVLMGVGKAELAIDAYRRAIAIRPDSWSAHNNLVVALKQAGRVAESIEVLRTIITLRPDYAQAYAVLANAIRDRGQARESLEIYREAIARGPEVSATYVNYASALSSCGQSAEAVEICRKAIELGTTDPQMYFQLGNALRERGDSGAAIAAYRKALALKPDSADAHDNLLFAMIADPDQDREAVWQEHRRWNAIHALPLLPVGRGFENDRSPDRRLRIGYVSADFCHHVVGFNLFPMFKNHDRSQFHITCYSNLKVGEGDAWTGMFRDEADDWREIFGVSDAEVAGTILADKIDILVDLSLHTKGNRLPVLARKPAPVQITFAGYPGTTGMTAIDYRLTDPFLDPPGLNDEFCSEHSVRLPHSFWVYHPMSGKPEVNELPALGGGAITFGCLNTFAKVNDLTLQYWRRVLQAVPDSRLMLLAPHSRQRQRAMEQLGVAEERIIFSEYKAHANYLAMYHQIDIGLDSYPYNGHTTSLDAMWMGVPVVSLCGLSVVSRAGFSQAMNLGLADLIAHTPDDFVSIAVELAHDLPRVAELRRTLRARMADSPLTDPRGFTHGVETAYRTVWRRWCGGG